MQEKRYFSVIINRFLVPLAVHPLDKPFCGPGAAAEIVPMVYGFTEDGFRFQMLFEEHEEESPYLLYHCDQPICLCYNENVAKKIASLNEDTLYYRQIPYLDPTEPRKQIPAEDDEDYEERKETDVALDEDDYTQAMFDDYLERAEQQKEDIEEW